MRKMLAQAANRAKSDHASTPGNACDCAATHLCCVIVITPKLGDRYVESAILRSDAHVAAFSIAK
jgi:hypothetical protein